MSTQIDDPHSVNAFFATLGDSLPSATEAQNSQEKLSRESKVEDDKIQTRTSYNNTATGNTTPAVDTSVAQAGSTSPAQGFRAPPTTPATNAIVATEEISHLPSVCEDQSTAMITNVKKLALKPEASESAPKHFDSAVHESRSNSQLRFAPNKLDFEPNPSCMTSVQIELLSKLGRSFSGHDNYHDDIIAKFKADPGVVDRVSATQGTSMEVGGESMEKNDMPSHNDQLINEVSFSLQETVMSSETTYDHPGQDIASSPVLTTSPATSPLAVPALAAECPGLSPQDVSEVKRDVDQSAVPTLQAPVPDENSLKQATDILASKIALVTVDQEERKPRGPTDSSGQSDAEDREHARVIKSWGTPAKRDKPASRIRKIILSQLPPKTDFTLIQSLIHGGSIDNMTIGTSGTTAQVTFTTGEACDNYYSKYPNGLVFKVKGKSHSIFVDKGKDVDVISGMLEGYLGAGATRVVQATEADEDWSMRALSKIAEGKKGQRKVESIVDSFRDELRTITFRFTSIADAVNFKATLLRDPDWEYCNIQFVADPCEKAVGVHLD